MADQGRTDALPLSYSAKAGRGYSEANKGRFVGAKVTLDPFRPCPISLSLAAGFMLRPSFNPCSAGLPTRVLVAVRRLREKLLSALIVFGVRHSEPPSGSPLIA